MMAKRPGAADIAMILWISALGVGFLNFQPLILAELVASGVLGESQAGFLASSNMFGMCMSLAATIVWMHRWTMSSVTLVALVLMGAGDLATGFINDFEALVLVRFLTGLGEGLAMAAGISVVSGLFANPGRMFAFVMVAVSLIGALGLYLLPFGIADAGLAGAMSCIAALSILTIPFHRVLPTPDIVSSRESATGVADLMNGPVVLLLVSLLLLFVGHINIWAYFGRIGAHMAIPEVDIGAALSASLVAAMFGGLAAAALGDRLGRMLPIGIGVSVTLSSLFVLYMGSGYTSFALAAVLMMGSTGFAVPYYLGTLALHDRTGRLPVIGKLTLYAGMFIGPAMGAMMVQPGNYDLLLLAGMGTLVLALVAAMLGLSRDSLKNTDFTRPGEVQGA
jgi:predicted MFS family arabinose efflux permease